MIQRQDDPRMRNRGPGPGRTGQADLPRYIESAIDNEIKTRGKTGRGDNNSRPSCHGETCTKRPCTTTREWLSVTWTPSPITSAPRERAGKAAKGMYAPKSGQAPGGGSPPGQLTFHPGHRCSDPMAADGRSCGHAAGVPGRTPEWLRMVPRGSQNRPGEPIT